MNTAYIEIIPKQKSSFSEQWREISQAYKQGRCHDLEKVKNNCGVICEGKFELLLRGRIIKEKVQ